MRHRSTARRLMSMGSRRADTSASLPNHVVIKPTVVPAPTASRRPWALRRRGIAVVLRRRRSTWWAATAPKIAGRSRVGVQIDFDVGYVAQVLADLADSPTNPITRPAPRCAEVDDGWPAPRKAQIRGSRVDSPGRLRVNF